MPLSHLNRRRFCHVVGIIPGPSEPEHVEPYVASLLDDFNRFGPSGGCSRGCCRCFFAGVLLLALAVSRHAAAGAGEGAGMYVFASPHMCTL